MKSDKVKDGLNFYTIYIAKGMDIKRDMSFAHSPNIKGKNIPIICSNKHGNVGDFNFLDVKNNNYYCLICITVKLIEMIDNGDLDNFLLEEK
jgi:hypothetical protein